MNILITGGAGFIGSALIRHLIRHTDHRVINVDKLTYAGNLDNLADVQSSLHYSFERADIVCRSSLDRIFAHHRPHAVVHLAAESHVDKSIADAGDFIRTNLVGTFTLLEAARHYWQALPEAERARFRFHHVSTDEVYGDLGGGSADKFTETTPYAPSSPYSASKAGSDHLVRAWQRTYGLPTLITHSSNNYGSRQFPEKLIPHMILNALSGRPLPVYGDGRQIRDWLYVDDHARALYCVLTHGIVGETYHIGGGSERRNIDVVHAVCDLLQELAPHRKPPHTAHYRDLITHVADRAGHDVRYAVDTRKIRRELGWQPQETFESGLRQTVQWYLDNERWWRRIQDGSYRVADNAPEG